MKRFRRKSESRSRLKDSARERDPSSGAEEAGEVQLPPLLPTLKRHSLILPHLTKRFSLLNGPDGQLVDLGTLQTHLTERVKTRMLTTQEADEVLRQFAIQREQQSAPALPRIQAQRLDWSLQEEGDESVRESFLSNSTADFSTSSLPDFSSSPSRFNSSTFGRASAVSAVPFPHSPESTASTAGSFSPALGSTGSSSASGSQPYKRGGNSLFAGRGKYMPPMSKNKSSTSVASSSSRSAHTAGEDLEVETEADDRSSGTSVQVEKVSEVGETTADEDEDEDNVQELDEGRARHSVGSSLSQKQLKRISRVLDDIEQDLSKTFVRSATPENITTDSFPRSPTSPANDTEAMDPHFHRLAPSPGPPSLASTSRRPSMASSLADSARRPSMTSLSADSPLQESSGPPPILAPPLGVRETSPPVAEQENIGGENSALEKDLNEEEVRDAKDRSELSREDGDEKEEKVGDEREPEPERIPLPSPEVSDDLSVNTSTPPTPMPIASPSLESTMIDLDPSAIRNRRSREISNTPSDFTISALSPTSLPSPPTSARSDIEQSFSDQDGPFDLSFGSTVGHSEVEEDDEEQLEAVQEEQSPSVSDLAQSKRHRRNISIISSTGSSYHAAAEDPLTDDDPLTTSSPHLGSLRVVSPSPIASLAPHGEEDDEHLRVSAESMSRRPSNELLETINSSSPSLGEADLALEDLLMIQETLVRSASRRAAARKAGLSPSSPNEGAEFGMRRGSGSDTYSWSRKGSLEGSGSGSDGRRGSESDGKWGNSLDGRRGSDGAPMATGRRRSSGMESGLSPYRSSRATGTSTSATGSSPRTNGAPTPSSQSDAFEFSSLVGSPDSGAWPEHKEQLASPRQPEEHSPLVNGDSPLINGESPLINGESPRSDFDSPDHSAFHSPNSQAAVSDEGHAEEVKDDDVRPSNEVATLGEPVKLDNESFLRVPRSSRDPAKTPSVLIRDVRNQATLATFALKKTAPSMSPTSPVMRSKSLAKSKSIRKGTISSPQLVSGTSDIPSVPIINPDIPSPLMSPKSPGKSSGSRREKRDADGSKSRGIGSRFKNLLKKQSRDQLPHLNGDEVTPFVDNDPDRTLSPPFTPPNQDSSTFSTPDYSRTPNQSDGTTDGRRSADYLRARSPSGLAVVAESPEAEQGSPANSTSSGSGNKMSLTRLLSRKRTASNRPRRESETSLAAGSSTDFTATPEPSMGGSPLARTASPGSSIGRRPSIEQEVFGLGLGPVHTDTSSRAPISYDIGSMRRRMGSESSSSGSHEVIGVAQTAPLALPPLRRSPPEPLDLKHFSFPANDRPSPSSNPQREFTSSQHRHTASNASDNSMRRLWEAAEDLGMPRDKVEELVNLSYAQSPTTSHTHSGSTSSTLGRQSQDGADSSSRHRKTSSTSHSNVASGHRRGLSSSASGSSGRQRTNSGGSSSRATPASFTSSASRQAPSPEAPKSLTVETGGGLIPGLRPPLSPSADSFRSSGYAGSVFDLYGSEDSGDREGRDDEDEEGEVVLKPRSVALDSPTLSETRYDGEEQGDNSLVWRVVDDLRRTSGVSSRSDSFGFNSRPSSTQSTDGPDPLAQLLRHHARNRSSGSIPTPAARFPSAYEADEKRLMELGRQGGVAEGTDSGVFLTRPKEVVEEEARVERARRESRQEEFSYL